MLCLYFRSEWERTLSVKQSAVPFCLQGLREDIEVLDSVSAQILDLSNTGNHLNLLSPSSFSNVLTFFFIAVKEYAVLETEMMLKQGTWVTGIGEVYVTDSGIKLCMPADGLPYLLTTMEMPALVTHLHKKKDFFKIMTGMFGAMGLFLIGVSLDAWWRRKGDFDQETYE